MIIILTVEQCLQFHHIHPLHGQAIIFYYNKMSLKVNLVIQGLQGLQASRTEGKKSATEYLVLY